MVKLILSQRMVRGGGHFMFVVVNSMINNNKLF